MPEYNRGQATTTFQAFCRSLAGLQSYCNSLATDSPNSNHGDRCCHVELDSSFIVCVCVHVGMGEFDLQTPLQPDPLIQLLKFK
jgi:hypothetical protein